MCLKHHQLWQFSSWSHKFFYPVRSYFHFTHAWLDANNGNAGKLIFFFQYLISNIFLILPMAAAGFGINNVTVSSFSVCLGRSFTSFVTFFALFNYMQIWWALSRWPWSQRIWWSSKTLHRIWLTRILRVFLLI